MLTFDEEKHEYRWNDRLVLNVTAALGEWVETSINGVFWCVNPVTGIAIPRAKMDAGAAHGKAVHEMLEIVGREHMGFDDELDDDMLDDTLKPTAKAIRQFYSDFKVEPIAIELAMYSEELDLAGTVDLICDFVYEGIDSYGVVDGKGGAVGQTTAAQTKAYEIMAGEVGMFKEDKPTIRGALVLTKGSDSYKFKAYEDAGADEMFLRSRLYQHKYLASRR